MSDNKPLHIVSYSQLITGIILGFITVIFLNSSLIFKYVFRFESETLILVENEVAAKSDAFFINFNSFPITASVVTMLLWSVVGIVVYFASQLIVKSAQDIEEDVVVSVSYIHPKNFRQSNFWFSVLLQFLYALFSVTVLSIWLLLTLTIFIPFSNVLLLIGLDSFSTNMLYGIALSLSSIGVVAFAYVSLFILIRILRSRIF
jgi:hypothetical protein